MGASVRRAVAADMYAVYRLLCRSTLNNRWLPLAARRRLFSPVWGGDQSYFGYLMENGGEVVGFLGTLFTLRTIRGRQEPFCEIHSWYVDDIHRNNSLDLLMPVLGLRRTHTLVNYTPTEAVHQIGKKFGFEDLETELRVFYPVPTATTNLRVLRRKWEIGGYLDPENLAIFQDHCDVFCHHLVILDRSGSVPLYLLMKSMRRKWYEPFGRLLYASDFKHFARIAGALAWRLCIRFGWQCIVSDERWFSGTGPSGFTRVVRREVPSQFYSTKIGRDELCPVYSQPLLQGYRLH
ncbi:hypothetical protein [Bradyrhizobium sp. ARR65]|uniref:hypothetical protein n=1 Tax=Bradyrhizobium sp. ARR65 TaxID=1040989 RepID=UPI000B12A826|nr:hypothetical protein [Bradyrhizobium sp. ARR65]